MPMKNILLEPIKPTPATLKILEKRKLIRTFTPTKNIINTTREKGAVDILYSSAPQHGGHKLICVRTNNFSKFKLNSHSDNEEFIIINTTKLKFKPLYLVVGLHKHKIIQNKIRKGVLSSKDFIVLDLKFNDPHTCVFTMLKDTPHCEITKKGFGNGPIFFVTEPTKMKTILFDLKNYNFSLAPFQPLKNVGANK
jgi:hypothetical protein